MCFYYDDYPQLQSTELRTARKEHQCEGCNNRILHREIYQFTSGRFDGAFFSQRVCGACCLDIWLIHVRELADGCRRYESWCAAVDLSEYIMDSEMSRSSREDGQAWLKRQRLAQRECTQQVAVTQ